MSVKSKGLRAAFERGMQILFLLCGILAVAFVLFISIYLMCQNKNASKPIMTASFALTSRLFLLIQTVRKYREKE